jgi:hypothetical protein
VNFAAPIYWYLPIRVRLNADPPFVPCDIPALTGTHYTLPTAPDPRPAPLLLLPSLLHSPLDTLPLTPMLSRSAQLAPVAPALSLRARCTGFSSTCSPLRTFRNTALTLAPPHLRPDGYPRNAPLEAPYHGVHLTSIHPSLGAAQLGPAHTILKLPEHTSTS